MENHSSDIWPERPQKQENKEGIEQYFMGRIGDVEVYFSNWQNINNALLEKIGKIKEGGEYLDYKKVVRQEEFLKKGVLSGGEKSYVLSQINKKDKWSNDYLDCTGVLFTGIKKGTGEKISFVTHQDPKFFIENKDNKLNFKKGLEGRIDALVRMCELNSINAMIFGGNDMEDQKKEIDEGFVLGRDDVDGIEDYFPCGKHQVYLDSIRFMDFIISNKLKNHPTVALGPNDNYDSPDNNHGQEKHSLSAYFDNENCKLYLIGPTRTHPESISANKIYERIKEMKKGN